MSKGLIKLTAVAVCFAFLMLVFPATIDAKPKRAKFNIAKIIRKPLTFFAKFTSLIPVYDTIPFQNGEITRTSQPSKNQLNPTAKSTGGLSSHRPSKDD